MNIFVTDENPKMAARNLDDKRVIKMILECTQLLSTAARHYGFDIGYAPTHMKHPATLWTRANSSNFRWVRLHGIGLCEEYFNRYGKTHACYKLLMDFHSIEDCIPKADLSPFVNCTVNKQNNISYKHINNTIEAYRRYLVDRWNTDKRKPTWIHLDAATSEIIGRLPSWVTLDNNYKLIYKDEKYETLFGGSDETIKSFGITGDVNSTNF